MRFSHRLLNILLAATVSIFTLQSAFAAITITPSHAPGVYHSPIKLELISSNPTAKIYYSFNPDGGPNDALAYSGPILLKSSTPLVYFGFVALDNESKVLIDDYVFDYPTTIGFATAITRENEKLKNVTLKNTGTGEVDLSYWEVRTQDNTISIPENTIIQPDATYTIGDIDVKGGQTILLASPDSETKDILVLDEVANAVMKKEVPKTVAKKTFKPTVVRELPAEIWIKPKIGEKSKVESDKIASSSEPRVTSEKAIEPTTTANTTSVIPNEAEGSLKKSDTETKPDITPSPETRNTQPENNLADNLKISASEKTSSSPYAPWIIISAAVAAGGIMGTRLILRKKK